MSTRHRGPDATAVDELERRLTEDACPICARAEDSVRAWFFSYENETNADPVMKETLTASLGLCAPHTRRLLDLRMSASWLATGLFDDVAHAALRRLDGAVRGPVAPCPPCLAAERGVTGLRGSLRRALQVSAGLRETYAASRGVCLAHAPGMLETRAVPVAGLVTDRLVGTLEGDVQDAAVALTGHDPDRVPRDRRWSVHRQAALDAEERALKTSVEAYVDLLLTTPACPICAARHRARWRFLDWLATCGTPARELRLEAVLCGTHLGDLAMTAPLEVTEDVAAYNAARRSADLHRAADRLAALPDTPAARLHAIARARWAGAVAPRRAVRAATAPAFRPAACRACAVVAAAERDARRLLAIAAADPGRERQVGRAHGPCLAHGLALDREGTMPERWRAVLKARLRTLAFELDAARHNAAWDARWKVHGAEMTAWQHAPHLLDGEVLGPRPPAAS